MGRRFEKAVTENSVTTTTRYLYDNEDIIAEYDGNGNLITKYIHGIGIDEPLAMEKNSSTYYYHADGLGSVVALTDSAGNVVQKYEYDSFGNITSIQNPSFIQPYMFTGREYDPENGTYHYRARTFDSKTGTFTQKDPIGFAAGDTNLYRYVFNRPTRYTDPLGLICSYGQNSGWIVCADDNSGKVYLVDKGYSGTGEGRNVGWMQDVKDVSPIPGGDWQVGPAIDHETLGKYTLPLTPLFLNDVFDTKRDKYPGAFAVHGNNLRDDASKGCMILKRESRKAIPSKEIIRVGL